MCETHWTELSRPSWDRDMNLQLSRHEIFCAAGPARQISTAKPTCTAGCELVLHKGNFLEYRRAFPGVRLRLRSARRLASPLQRHGASQRNPLLLQGRRRFVVTWEDQRDHDYGWGIFGAFFLCPGTDQASSSSGALQDFDGI